MVDLIQTGSTWLGTKLASFAAQSGNYSRGSAALAAVSFTVADTRWEADGEMVVVDWHGQDFVFTAASTTALITAFSGPPKRGDKVTWDGDTYEVMAPQGVTPWRYSDRYEQRIRIHTKRVPA